MSPITEPASASRRYVLGFLLLFLSAIPTVVALGLATDPYAFSWPHHVFDPAFRENDLEVRMNIIRQVTPDVVLMGNSRAQHGLDPENPVFGRQKVFNAAIVGGKPDEFLAMLGPAEERRRLSTVIIGLDYNMPFSGAPRTPNPRLLIASGIEGLLHRLQSTLSIEAVQASLIEIQRYIRRTDHLFAEDGRLREPLYRHDVAARGGTLAAVEMRDAQAMAQMDGPYTTDFFTPLAALRDIACAHHTRLILFISPVHVRQLEAVEQSGRWADFDEWKRGIVRLVAQRPNCPVELWDFARHHPLVEEDVPVDGPMRYYWESSHYKKALGDKVLARVYGGDGGDFGERLTPANIEDSLAREDKAHRAFRAGHPEMVVELEKLRRAGSKE